MAIKLGTQFQLDIKGIDKRLFSELVGMEEGKFLIVKMPEIYHQQNISSFVSKKKEIVVRYLENGIVYGFETYIIKAIYDPSELLFIDFPIKIENFNLRKNKRILTYFPSKIVFDEEILNGQIINISKNGCLLTSDSDNYKKLNKLMKAEADILLTLFMPGVEEEMSIDGKVKNIQSKDKLIEIGINFVNMDIITRTQIHDFISATL
ncbi:MAG: flagellar brake protein [Candidatus Cloacimonadota bacterium]|nr:flagellar brake protein [Candidatus Cloacimonadota bacterium]